MERKSGVVVEEPEARMNRDEVGGAIKQLVRHQLEPAEAQTVHLMMMMRLRMRMVVVVMTVVGDDWRRYGRWGASAAHPIWVDEVVPLHAKREDVVEAKVVGILRNRQGQAFRG